MLGCIVIQKNNRKNDDEMRKGYEEWNMLGKRFCICLRVAKEIYYVWLRCDEMYKSVE